MSLPVDRLAELNGRVADWYTERLWADPEAVLYVRSRGISDETARKWRLGLAPRGGRELCQALAADGWGVEDLVEPGFVRQGDRGVSDYFRHRLMFPILDTDGRRVLGFSGRDLGGRDDAPKYLGSPGTALYRKRSTLYGAPNHIAIRQAEEALVVEGNVDMLAVYQSGHRNVVATCGTALTGEHLATLGQWTRRVTLALDSDEAGLAATRKAILSTEARTLDVRVLPLVGDKDPASILLADPAALDTMETVGRWDWLWQSYEREHERRVAKRSAPDGRTDRFLVLESVIIWKDAWCSLVRDHMTDPVLAASLLARAATAFGIRAEIVQAEFAPTLKARAPSILAAMDGWGG